MQRFATKAAPIGAAFLFAALSLTGCATGDFGGSRARVIEWAGVRGFVASESDSGGFRLLTLRRGQGGTQAAVYIEGDGAPWPTAFNPPRDPTPLRPLALELAAADPAPVVIYLGRPCQYLDDILASGCSAAYWSDRRFAPEVVAAYDMLLTQLQRRIGVGQFLLHGYSGGGVLASLIAARRTDVGRLVTVAAPLSLEKWTTHHGVSPLRGSLDPAAIGENKAVLGVHFAGAADRTVPIAVLQDYVRRQGGRVVAVPGFDHECCWARDWRRLLDEAEKTGGAK